MIDDGLLQQPIGWISRNPKRVGIALAATILLVYAGGVSAEWFIGHDSGLYLCLARNLARGLGYTLNGQPSAFVPPACPFLLSWLMQGGWGSFLAMNAVMTAMGLTTVALAYLLLRNLVHRDWAMVLTAVLALSTEMTQRSGEILSDVPFAMQVIAALWLYLRGLRQGSPCRRGWEIASLLLVGTCWFRVAGFPLAGGAAVGLVIAAVAGWVMAVRHGLPTRKQQAWIAARAVLNAAIVAGGLWATLTFFRHAQAATAGVGASYAGIMEQAAAGGFLQQWLWGPLAHLYETSGQLSRLFFSQRLPLAMATVFLFGPILVAMARRLWRGETVGPLAVLCYVGALSVYMLAFRTRYLLPLMPLLLVYLAEGYAIVGGWIARMRPPLVSDAPGEWPRRGPVALAMRADLRQAFVFVLMGVMLAMNGVLVVRMVCQKHRGDFATEQQHALFRDQYRAAEFLRTAEPRGTVLSGYPVAYLADRECPSLPGKFMKTPADEEQVKKFLADHDFAFIALDPGDNHRDMEKSISAYLKATRKPVFTSGEMLVFRLEQNEGR